MKLLCAVLIASLALPALADVYRWTDAAGKVHYSDKKPAGEAEDITRAVSKQNIDTSTAEHQKLEQVLRKENAADRQYYEQQRVQAFNEKTQRCNAIRERIWRISGRVSFVDKQGREVKVTEAERNAQIEELNKYLARECQ